MLVFACCSMMSRMSSIGTASSLSLRGHVEPCIDGHDEIAAIHLQAMAGVEEEGCLAVTGTHRRIRRSSDSRSRLPRSLTFEHLEAERPKLGRDIERVVLDGRRHRSDCRACHRWSGCFRPCATGQRLAIRRPW